MPQQIRLPDGRYVTFSSDPAKAQRQRDDIDLIYGTPQSATPDVDTKNFWDNPFGGIGAAVTSTVEAIPQIASSFAQSAIGVVTPGVDLPIEQRLREAAAKKARERDPNYATSQAVGMGLGQVGVMTGLHFLGPWGSLASRLTGISLNMSESMRRIAEYEKRTGVDVPWWKESTMHLIGAGIGLTEQLTPMQLEAKIGGIVGGIANATQRIFLGKYAKYINPYGMDQQMEEVLRQGQYRNKSAAREAFKIIDPNSITSDLESIIGEGTTVTQGLADDILRSLGGQDAALPFGMESVLRQGNVDQFTLDRLIGQTRNSTQKLMEELKVNEDGASGQDKQQFVDAQGVVTQIMQP
mgnify:CR=1 FL=1